MMQHLNRLVFFFLILTIQGCQSFTPYQPSPEEILIPTEQEQLYKLLRQGKRYDDLSDKQRQAVCKRLKQDYQVQGDWQTAWLLVYSLNNDFSCVSLNKTLDLLNAIQTQQGSSQSQWLNKNQIKILNKLKRFNRLQKKNERLQNQLNEAEIQLQDVISKIQALKAIETSINKKTQ